jgi:urea transport system ATP-binding protein
VIHHLAKDRNFAVVLVEQYFEFARDLADTITVMVRGEVALAGPTKELDEEEVRKLLTV